MKFNPFDGVQAADWALTAGAEASARHANARRACFRCDLLGGVYISGQARRSPFLNTAAFSITDVPGGRVADKLSAVTNEDVLVRRENADDVGAIRVVNEVAFGGSEEADLVDRLRKEGAVLASFVAESEGRVIGHIMFSRMLIEAAESSIPSVALAPLAVLPTYQRGGVGSRLVQFGLEWLRTRGERSVLVLGHPRYYQRFGFSTDRARALTSSFSPDAFMALELVANALDGIRGSVRYPAAFGL
jgi:putative acetyltransferase